MAELKPGREMDVAVARVLGCTPVRKDSKWDWQCKCDSGAHITKCVDDEQGDWYELADYSISDANVLAALDAVMAKRDDLSFLLCREWSQTEWEVTIGRLEDNCVPGKYIKSFGKTRAEAICRAILALAEVEAA